MEPKPQFLVIGGSRCGTTTLHAALERHPDIFVPADKSPNFFTAPDMEDFPGSAAMAAMKGHTIKTAEAYLGLFRYAANRIRGEVSPVYLQSIRTAARAHAFAPDLKIMAILRNPVERAFAHFMGRRRDGLEDRKDFATAIEAELSDARPKELAFNHYLAIGRYAHYLAPWFAVFAPERIKILFFDDFKASPHEVLNQMFDFIGAARVEADFRIDHKNQSGIASNSLMRWIWTRTTLPRARLRSHLPKSLRDAAGRIFLGNLQKHPFPENLRSSLVRYYADDWIQLEKITDRNLDAWRGSPIGTDP